MAGALQLQVITAGEACRPFARQALGRVRLTIHQRLPHFATQRAGQADQVRRGLRRQPVGAQLSAATVLVFQIRTREQHAQLAVARAVAAVQQHAMRLVALCVIGDPAIHADDRLHSAPARALVELDHAEQVGEVGNTQRRHAVVGGGLERVINLNDAIDHRELGVHA